MFNRLQKFLTAIRSSLTGRRLFPVMTGLARDERGVIIVMFALLLPIMIGFVGLGVEIAFWFQDRRDLQTAADAGAIAGAYEIAEGRVSSADTVAQREAENNGWSSANGDGITVNNDQINSTFPSSGNFDADTNAIEVILTRTLEPLFIGYFMDSLTLTAGAVATTVAGGADACVLALADGDPGQAVKIAGGSNVTLSGCAIAINSTDNQALKITGTAQLTTDCVYIEGGGGVSGNDPTTTQCSGVKSGQPEIADPYADIAEPTAELDLPCTGDFDDFRQTSGSGTVVPGTYCDGIEVTGGSLSMDPGLYIMDDGNFKITGGASVSGTGVTIVLMDSSGGNSCGIFTLSGGGSFDMTAQTTGTYAGFLFFRHATCSNTASDMKFVGGSNATVVGVIYSPSKEVKISGGTSVSGSCLQIVADTVEISGSGTFGNDCDGTGVDPINAGSKGGLVE